MYFLIGGIQPRRRILARRTALCSLCGHHEVYLKRIDHYLSLFFIPLFPVKRGMPFLECQNCHNVVDERGDSIGFDGGVSGKRCASCGKSLDRDFTYCPYCGSAV